MVYKTLKKKHINKYKRKYKKTRKNRRTLRYKKGGTNEKCSMCDKVIINDKKFIPSGCLMKHGRNRSHKICSDCWWNKFAIEGVNHKCPGCESGLPLNNPVITKIEVIDLVDD
jgi:LSD1 subclass zinc finger protein